MRPEDLTKEQVEEMSDDEVNFWCQQFAKQEQTANLRKHMLNQIEIRDTSEPRVIQIDSKVVE